MPKNGVPQSRKRRETAAAEREAKAPLTERRKASPLAKMLRNPTAQSVTDLMDAASNGELTPVDIQAAIAAQLVAARKLLPKAGRPPSEKVRAARKAEAEQARPVMVLMKQLTEALKDTVTSAGGGGPLMVVELLWPEAYAHTDIGEQVRLRAPSEMAPSEHGAPHDEDDEDDDGVDDAVPQPRPRKGSAVQQLDEDDPSAEFLRGFK